jgi:hypothetical protein
MAMRIIVGVIQLLISSIGIYNIGISFLPDPFYSSIPDVRQIKITVFGFVSVFTHIFLNLKEVMEHFLTVSIIPDSLILSFGRLSWLCITSKIIIGVYFIIVMSYTLYQLGKIMTNIYKKRNTEIPLARNDAKWSNSRKKREKSAITT